MEKQNIVFLIIFVLLAGILNFLPHLNYPYPFHADEWVHYQYANHLSSNAPLYFGQESYSLEGGFHALLATLNAIGLPYNFMFVYFPALIMILITLSVFIFTRKLFNETAAVFSVLFVALLKSTVLILGPVFLVPMAIGLFIIPIMLYLIKIESKSWILILAAILMIHPPTATALLLLINIEFALKRKNWHKNLLYQLIAGLIAFPFYFPYFFANGPEAINALSFMVMDGVIFIPRFLGYISTALIILGIYFSSSKKNYSIVAYCLALIVFAVAFFQFKIEYFIPYRRVLMYIFIVFSVPFGLACSEIIDLGKSKKIKYVLAAALIIIMLFAYLPGKLESNGYLYRVIDNQDYEAFKYIKENTPQNSIVVSNPVKANALNPIAERIVFSRAMQGPNAFYEARNNQIFTFFNESCQDINFLKENNITIVYGNCDSQELEEVYPNVYLVP